MYGPSTVSEEQDRPIVAYTLSGVRKAVGHGATAPEIGDVAAIIKQDGGESRAQVYSEYVAGRLAAMAGVTVATGVFVAHARGLRYASLKIAEVGFSLTDIEAEHAAEAAARYPVEAANLAVFDAWICNADRAGNLRANLAQSTDNLMIGLDHGGSLLSVADTIDTALDRLRRVDWPPGHVFRGMLDRRLMLTMAERIQQLPDAAIQDACILGGTVGSAMLTDQAMLAEALIWRRENLQIIVDRILS
jgi:hypothetical protein